MSKTYDWNIVYDNMVKKNKDLRDIVLNEKNRVITKDYLKMILNRYGVRHVINDIKMFEICVTHNSYRMLDFRDLNNFKTIFKDFSITNDFEIPSISQDIKNDVVQLKSDSYERLEFLGDALMHSILSEYLVCRFPDMDSGELSALRAQLESSNVFSSFCKLLGLHKYILLSRLHELNNSRDRHMKIQCDIFEAFMCALYFDIANIKYEDIGKVQGIILKDRGDAYQKCYSFVINMIEDENNGLDLCAFLETNTNYKSRLISLYHSLGWKDPEYPLIEVKTIGGKKSYLVGVHDNEKNVIATYESTCKKQAEKMCALCVLNDYNVIENTE